MDRIKIIQGNNVQTVQKEVNEFFDNLLSTDEIKKIDFITNIESNNSDRDVGDSPIFITVFIYYIKSLE